MSNLISNIRNNHDLIYKGILALLCISAIVFVFPKEAKFKYEFQKNKPWKHEKLFAPFDFAILKSEEALAKEKQEIIDRNTLHFKVRQEVAQKQEAAYVSLFEDEWPNSRFAQNGNMFNRLFKKEEESHAAELIKILNIERGRSLLSKIYQKGILSLDDVIEDKSPDFGIVLVRDNISEDKEIKDLYTISEAYERISDLLKREAVQPGDGEQLDVDLLERVLKESLSPNVFYDVEKTQRMQDAQLESVSPVFGKVEKDVGIIDRGDIVTEERFQELISLKREYESQTGGSSNYYIILAGQVILVSVVVLVLIFFLGLFRKDLMEENRNLIFLLLMLTIMAYMAGLTTQIESLNIYALPFCILPVIIRIFYDVRISIFMHFMSIILVGFLAPNGFEFVFLQTVTGIIVVFALVSLRKRSQLLTIIGIIFLTYSLTYLGFAIIQEGEFETIKSMNFAWFGASAVLTLFAFPLVYIFEKIFGFISDVTLMELSDTNSPLLRELASKSPGTFQHTLQVSNLAEAAVLHIGGDPLLVRTGALYHDIGKMANPLFFIENQISGVNPHDEISHHESARVIIDHVIKGIEMAKRAKLPEVIIDFIRTHHGTSKTLYFLNAYKNEHPDEEVDETKFQYPGPPPYSKETAILMMADSVEAASRSLKKHDSETIGNLVEGIIDAQAAQKQFVNANITFQDISNIKSIFKKMLMNIYHVRIEYPKEIKEE